MEEKIDPEKEFTQDDVARLVTEGFLNLEAKFDLVGEKLASIEERLSEIESDTKEMDLAIREMKAELGKKTDKIEFDALKYHIRKIDQKTT